MDKDRVTTTGRHGEEISDGEIYKRVSRRNLSKEDNELVDRIVRAIGRKLKLEE